MIAALVVLAFLVVALGVVAFVLYQRARDAEAAQQSGNPLGQLIRTFGPLLAFI